MRRISRQRKTNLLVVLLIFFAALGFGDSIVIHLETVAQNSGDVNALASCDLSSLFSCVEVARSRYSYIFGIPVALLGMVYYEAVFMLGLGLYFKFKMKAWQHFAFSVIIASSVIFSYYLLYMSYFGIGAICLYCLTSVFADTGIAVIWALYSRHTGFSLIEDKPE